MYLLPKYSNYLSNLNKRKLTNYGPKRSEYYFCWFWGNPNKKEKMYFNTEKVFCIKIVYEISSIL